LATGRRSPRSSPAAAAPPACIVTLQDDRGAFVSSPAAEEARDLGRTAAQMVEHLRHVEASLNFQRRADDEIDLDAVFS
jgi:hypothetical protein